MERRSKTSAIIVAAGKGTRMKMDCPKQFIEVQGKPLLYYTLKAFQKSKIDDVVVVVSSEYVSYVLEDIVKRYDMNKVIAVVEGGNERYESVYRGIMSLQDSDYLLVHDGARPYIEPELINRVISEVFRYKAVIVGVRSKDTVKIVNENGFVESTPNRNNVWNIQTPQAFEYNLLKNAYDKVMNQDCGLITDDAMVVETAVGHQIKVIEGSYKNIKVTTREDLREDYLQGLF